MAEKPARNYEELYAALIHKGYSSERATAIAARIAKRLEKVSSKGSLRDFQQSERKPSSSTKRRVEDYVDSLSSEILTEISGMSGLLASPVIGTPGGVNSPISGNTANIPSSQNTSGSTKASSKHSVTKDKEKKTGGFDYAAMRKKVVKPPKLGQSAYEAIEEEFGIE